MPTATIFCCPFQLKPTPRGAELADPTWPHLPWLVNPAVNDRFQELREALARRASWRPSEGGLWVYPVVRPESCERFVDVPDDEVWAEVATSFVNAPGDVLPFCAIEALIATLEAMAAEARTRPPWLSANPASFDEPNREERLAMIGLEGRMSQLDKLDHPALEELRQAGLLAEVRAETRAKYLAALRCPTLEAHVRAVMRTWAYLRSGARRLQIPKASVPADILDAAVSHELFVLQPELSDRIAAFAEWVIEDQQSWRPFEGESGASLRHDASGTLELAWKRGPRGQPQVVGVRRR